MISMCTIRRYRQKRTAIELITQRQTLEAKAVTLRAEVNALIAQKPELPRITLIDKQVDLELLDSGDWLLRIRRPECPVTASLIEYAISDKSMLALTSLLASLYPQEDRLVVFAEV